jgi:Protein of unknown function (DUF3565)
MTSQVAASIMGVVKIDRNTSSRRIVKQPITGFHQDEHGHWVAELACGHNQHVRHDPPWQLRPWVLTEEGRRTRLGEMLNCVLCDDTAVDKP